MKILTTTLVLLGLLTSGCSSFPRSNTEEAFLASAGADVVSTAIAINQPGIVEGNPAGFIGTTVGKGFLYFYAKENPEQAEAIYHTGTSIFTGAAVNNILLAVGAASGVSILAGILTGFFIYSEGDSND